MRKPWNQARVITQSQLILESYSHWTGESLIDESHSSEKEMAQALFEAPMVVVSHGLGKDPVLNYGNRLALELWEMTWDSFIQTPSRLTAEIINRAERESLLKTVREKGYSKDYQGIRISSSGRRFAITHAMVWNIINAKQNHLGQAATFKSWRYLDDI